MRILNPFKMAIVHIIMSINKEIVKKMRDCFSRGDKDGVLALVTDDIEWTELIDGVDISKATHKGKEAYVQNMSEPPGGWPLQMETTRMTEENNVVVVEGIVRVPMEDGSFITIKECNIDELENGKVKRVTSIIARVVGVQ